MVFSTRGLELLKQFEGFRALPYYDVGGTLTIGYGTVVQANVPLVMDENLATLYLWFATQRAQQVLATFVVISLNQNQYDALVSFIYNIGITAFEDSTMLRLLNQNNVTAAADQFARWVHSHGVIVAGLVNRRNTENNFY